MECTISIDGDELNKFLRRDITKEEFAAFCENAVISKLWEEQMSTQPAERKKDKA